MAESSLTIKDLNKQTLETCLSAKQSGKQIIITNGCFDVIHLGHLRYLQASKELAENSFLVVGLNSDASVKQLKGSNRPINSQLARRELLLGLRPVDGVIVFEELNALGFFKYLQTVLKPDIYTKGADYLNKNCEEFDYCFEHNIDIAYIDFNEGFSSTQLIEALNS